MIETIESQQATIERMREVSSFQETHIASLKKQIVLLQSEPPLQPQLQAQLEQENSLLLDELEQSVEQIESLSEQLRRLSVISL